MAKIFPTLKQIDLLKVKPTKGERKLLYFLNSTLDDTYEVYFQPFLNGDNPDIIILRKNSGAMIIEVKDWDLNSYQLNANRNWELKNINNPYGKKQIVKSPIQQVFEYKENLFNLHIENLLEKKIKNPKFWSVVTCSVYFHNASKKQIDTFLQFGQESNKAYLKFLSHFEILGNDSLTKENFQNILAKRWLNKKSFLFDNELYKSFKRYLSPPFHSIEQGKPITYSSEQQKIIKSKSNTQQKIKGVAGCGKTLALAKRAVNAHLRHNDNVLILTFNISLRNYIHDCISDVRENFEWKYFTILHYHQFIKAYKNNENLVDEEENEIINSNNITFQTIIIDEVQDYDRTWIINVKQFLAKDGEFVVFGDEKQNIYQRELDNKKPYTSIGGPWYILKKSFRTTVQLTNLATKFQRTFFTNKYDYDEIIIQTRLDDVSFIKYYYLNNTDIQEILNIYNYTITEKNIHDNDVCFLSSKVEILRLIDKSIRDKFNKKTNTMFETQEIYEELQSKNTINDIIVDWTNLKKELETVRRNKKFNFWNNSGTTKLSTIHSFKGWEIHTLFLIIENENNNGFDFTTDELIYSAITRCRQNLIIINIGNKRYDDFFKKNVPDKSITPTTNEVKT
ncbi:MAG TPA: NERD domain-containing protein [Bacteroidales bacterium]|nr:NERD domain-containing protein [Bacteroidales bacterium]HQB20773.1 NERD domain-containing protein [Bacteroidales bacterium]